MERLMKEYLIEQVKELAMVHTRQECCGLPLCAACRAVILLRNDLNGWKANVEIDKMAEGTKVYL